MKTKHKFRLSGLFALLLTLLSFSPTDAKAQCPVIHNTLNCPVRVSVTFYRPDPMGTCTQICSTYIIPNINPNQIVPINCNLCPGYCDISVTVTMAGGIPASGSANMSNPPPGNPVTGLAPCVSGPASIYYLAIGNRFRIVP